MFLLLLIAMSIVAMVNETMLKLDRIFSGEGRRFYRRVHKSV